MFLPQRIGTSRLLYTSGWQYDEPNDRKIIDVLRTTEREHVKKIRSCINLGEVWIFASVWSGLLPKQFHNTLSLDKRFKSYLIFLCNGNRCHCVDSLLMIVPTSERSDYTEKYVSRRIKILPRFLQALTSI